jgi:hypothetical protein
VPSFCLRVLAAALVRIHEDIGLQLGPDSRFRPLFQPAQWERRYCEELRRPPALTA